MGTISVFLGSDFFVFLVVPAGIAGALIGVLLVAAKAGREGKP